MAPLDAVMGVGRLIKGISNSCLSVCALRRCIYLFIGCLPSRDIGKRKVPDAFIDPITRLIFPRLMFDSSIFSQKKVIILPNVTVHVEPSVESHSTLQTLATDQNPIIIQFTHPIIVKFSGS